MEIKQHTLGQPMGQRRSHKINQKYLEKNGNENTTYQNLLSIAKAVLRGNTAAVNEYIKKERS